MRILRMSTTQYRVTMPLKEVYTCPLAKKIPNGSGLTGNSLNIFSLRNNYELAL